MQIDFQITNFKADQKLLDFITQKLEKLETFYGRIINSVVYLKLDNSEGLENKLVEIKLNVKNETLFANERRKSFEEATDTASQALRSQLIKYKEKYK
jgi:putative sigma-54 modulation protein